MTKTIGTCVALSLVLGACQKNEAAPSGSATVTQGSPSGALTTTSATSASSATTGAPHAGFAKGEKHPMTDPSNQGTAAAASSALPASIYDISVKRIDGTSESLGAYKGKVVLIVNTASECGFTPQYQGLEKLHKDLRDKGFSVLGFPSNDFGEQEPGTNAEIATFCTSKFGVDFPLFEKSSVAKDPGVLYKYLAAKAGPPKWNFHKYLIGKNGELLKAFPSAVAPDSSELRAAIEAALSN